MARPLRIEFPGAVYHVMSRGNERQRIYGDEYDRRTFLTVLEKTCIHHDWDCHAYCLMGNHYHLLVETHRANLARGMRQLNGIYTQRYNYRHERIGHLFQGRYKAVLIEPGIRVAIVARYILLNPVNAKLVSQPERWKWSNYRFLKGASEGPKWLGGSLIFESLKIPGSATEQLVEFMEYREDESSLESYRCERMSIFGDNEFKRAHTKGKARVSAEVPRREARPTKRSLQRLLSDGGKPAEITAAYDEGYRMVEIARHLGVHYTTVSQRLRRARQN